MSIRKRQVKTKKSDIVIKKKPVTHRYTSITTDISPPHTLRTLVTQREGYNVNTLFSEASKIRGYKSLIKPLSHRTYDSQLLTIAKIDKFDSSKSNNILPVKKNNCSLSTITYSSSINN